MKRSEMIWDAMLRVMPSMLAGGTCRADMYDAAEDAIGLAEKMVDEFVSGGYPVEEDYLDPEPDLT